MARKQTGREPDMQSARMRSVRTKTKTQEDSEPYGSPDSIPESVTERSPDITSEFFRLYGFMPEQGVYVSDANNPNRVFRIVNVCDGFIYASLVVRNDNYADSVGWAQDALLPGRFTRIPDDEIASIIAASGISTEIMNLAGESGPDSISSDDITVPRDLSDTERIDAQQPLSQRRRRGNSGRGAAPAQHSRDEQSLLPDQQGVPESPPDPVVIPETDNVLSSPDIQTTNANPMHPEALSSTPKPDVPESTEQTFAPGEAPAEAVFVMSEVSQVDGEDRDDLDLDQVGREGEIARRGSPEETEVLQAFGMTSDEFYHTGADEQLQTRIDAATQECDKARLEYVVADSESRTVMSRLKGVLGISGKGIPNETVENKKTAYQEKLRELRDLRLERIKALHATRSPQVAPEGGGTQEAQVLKSLEKELEDELRHFSQEVHVGLYTAWTELRAEQKGILGRIKQCGTAYNKLSWQKKVILGVPVAALAVASGAGLVGTAMASAAIAAVMARRGVAATGLFAAMDGGLQKYAEGRAQKMSEKIVAQGQKAISSETAPDFSNEPGLLSDVASEVDKPEENQENQVSTMSLEESTEASLTARLERMQSFLDSEVIGSLDQTLASRIRGQDRRRLTALAGSMAVAFGIPSFFASDTGREMTRAATEKVAQAGSWFGRNILPDTSDVLDNGVGLVSGADSLTPDTSAPVGSGGMEESVGTTHDGVATQTPQPEAPPSPLASPEQGVAAQLGKDIVIRQGDTIWAYAEQMGRDMGIQDPAELTRFAHTISQAQVDAQGGSSKIVTGRTFHWGVTSEQVQAALKDASSLSSAQKESILANRGGVALKSAVLHGREAAVLNTGVSSGMEAAPKAVILTNTVVDSSAFSGPDPVVSVETTPAQAPGEGTKILNAYLESQRVSDKSESIPAVDVGPSATDTETPNLSTVNFAETPAGDEVATAADTISITESSVPDAETQATPADTTPETPLITDSGEVVQGQGGDSSIQKASLQMDRSSPRGMSGGSRSFTEEPFTRNRAGQLTGGYAITERVPEGALASGSRPFVLDKTIYKHALGAVSGGPAYQLPLRELHTVLRDPIRAEAYKLTPDHLRALEQVLVRLQVGNGTPYTATLLKQNPNITVRGAMLLIGRAAGQR